MGKKRRSGGCCGWFLVLLVFAAIAFGVFVFARYKRMRSEHSGADTKKYADALTVAMQFFDVQKSGKLEENPIPWRGDSALRDGSEVKLDLSKGMYDAGDHMKFNFPMAFTATVLSWAILEYGNQMDAVDQLEPAQASLRWITDYLVSSHPKDNVLYIQVGNPKVDHACWTRPEDMAERRPLVQINASAPGTEVAAEAAAALASASLVFKNEDPAYSSSLLKHAAQLFSFADKYRGSYSTSVPEVQAYYNSTGYGDELLWAAAWLYHATGEGSYLEYVAGDAGENFAEWGRPTWFSWDNKLAGAEVLLSRVAFFDPTSSVKLENYRKSAEAVMCNLLPDSPSASSSRTHSGLIWVSEWNALLHPVASAFLALVYSDYMLSFRSPKIVCDGRGFTPIDLRVFAASQADYILGNNPMNTSYLVGYGDKYPAYVHHRGSSIPARERPGCKDGFKWLDSDEPNPNVAVGALVGGPFLNESYVDERNNSMQGEPTTYNSAVIVGLLSGLASRSSVVQSFSSFGQ